MPKATTWGSPCGQARPPSLRNVRKDSTTEARIAEPSENPKAWMEAGLVHTPL